MPLWRVVKVLFTVVTLTACAPAGAEERVLGILSFRPKAEVQQRWQPLADYLGLAIPGLTVTVRALSYPELNVALAGNELDFVFTNPAHYIELREHNRMSGAIATLIEDDHGRALPQFGGTMVCLSGRKDIADLVDLAGKRIAVTDLSSLGGYQMQARELHRAGIALPVGGNLVITGMPHDRVIETILDGKADVGFVRAGVIEHLAAEGRLVAERLRVIHRQPAPDFPYALSTPLYPEWPFVVLPKVDDRLSRRIASALLSIEPGQPLASRLAINGFAVPADYSPVEALMRELRLPPFDAPLPVTVADIWQRYDAILVTLAAAAVVILAMVLRLGAVNRRLAAARNDSAAIADRLQQSEERLRLAINGVNDGVWDWRVGSDELYLSPKWKEMLGYRDHELPNSFAAFEDHMHAEDQHEFREALDGYLRGSTDMFHVVFRLRHRSGEWRWILSRGEAHRDVDGKAVRMVGANSDITAQKLAENQLRLSASVFASSQEGILISDADNRIVDVNEAFTRITGYERDEVIGRNPSMLGSGRQGADFYRDMWRALAHGNAWRGQIWNRRKDGQLYAELLSIACVRDHRGRAERYVGVFSDISPLKAHEAALDRLANYDRLTGVPSRRLLDDRLTQALTAAQRHRHMVAVCYVDLDGFKPVNDHYGHAAGDRMLVAVAAAMQSALRGHDTVARIGGDEFVLVLSEVGERNDVIRSLDRLIAAIGRPVDIGGSELVISASLGVALYPDDGRDPDTLLQRADQAMYRAKKLGRNRYQLFDAATCTGGDASASSSSSAAATSASRAMTP